jgi:hypothetical protein
LTFHALPDYLAVSLFMSIIAIVAANSWPPINCGFPQKQRFGGL